jgi:hypothetical protein
VGKERIDSGKNILVEVKVHPRARSQGVQKIGDKEYRVRVLSPPSDGKANKEVVLVLASHFRLPSSRVKIIRGQKSRNKLVALEF